MVVWDSHIGDRTNTTHLPVSCYASWAQANEAFQKDHLGKVALTGDELTQYCLWRSSLDMQQGSEWDIFFSGLKPGTELLEKLDAFRFSSELKQIETNNQPTIPHMSDYPRELIRIRL